MKLETQLKNYLQEIPHARERRNKVRCVSNLIQKNHPAIRLIPSDVMDEIVNEVISLERYWRDILLKNPHLRGKDYETKKVVVQKKQVELGYESSSMVKEFEGRINK